MIQHETPIHRARRSDGCDIVHAVQTCVDETRADLGDDALTPVERTALRAFELDTWLATGGFECYFAHVDDERVWREMVASLSRIGARDLASVARRMVAAYPEIRNVEDVSDYFASFDEYDRAFTSKARNGRLQAKLAEWLERNYPWAA